MASPDVHPAWGILAAASVVGAGLAWTLRRATRANPRLRTRDILESALDEYGWGTEAPRCAACAALSEGYCGDEACTKRRRWARWGAIRREGVRRARDAAEEDEIRALRRPPFDLPEPQDMPAHAILFAARVLQRAVQGSPEAWRGGWDSMGHWGLGSGELLYAWKSARGRTGARFEAILRWILRHPGEGIPRLQSLTDTQALYALRVKDVYREYRPQEEYPDDARVSTPARVALGRLEPEARAAALFGSIARAERGVIRVRHLDWEAARQVRAVVQRTPEGLPRARVIAAMQARVGHERSAARWWPEQQPLMPQYPQLHRTLALRLVLGETPAALAPGLTSREAHAWCVAGAPEAVAQWLLDTLCPGETLGMVARDIVTARWLAAVLRDPLRREALTREREIPGPGGVLHTVRYADRVDEIIEADLPHGPRTGVDVAFRAAAERRGLELTELLRHESRLLASPPSWWKPVRFAKLLLTGAELVAEGHVMAHCVAGYAPAVQRGDCYIVAIDVWGHRSTVELSSEGRVVQHRGYGNREPDALCVHALQMCLRRWNLAPTRK